MPDVKRALISVSDKSGVEEFARGLSELGVEIVSTGGTAKVLKDAGIRVVEVSEVTGFPEIMDGRVKTLHPAVHGGILARRENSADRKVLEEQEITPIDLVAVNLYPFRETVARKGVTVEEAVEQIDIGGPTLIRGAAKNHGDVLVVVRAERYGEVLTALRKGEADGELRRRLAREAFEHTALYDAAIAEWFAAEEGETFPRHLTLSLERGEPLRYGENPHQKGGIYREMEGVGGTARARKLSGKEMSFNNWLDLDAAWLCASEFDEPAVAVIKHNNPCGAATGEVLADLFEKAWEGDPVSAFGSVIGMNREVDPDTAQRIVAEGRFVEAVGAPSFHPEALEILTTRPKWGKNVRLLRIDPCKGGAGWDAKRIEGGFLVQERDRSVEEIRKGEVKGKTPPTDEQWRDLAFAWRVCRNVRSNAIVLAKDRAVVGVGAGQMSRVDAVEIAVKKAAGRVKGAVLASDAFFPFADGVEAAAKGGVAAVVQPGGSVRDPEVVEAADRHGIPMVFTGVRHFRH